MKLNELSRQIQVKLNHYCEKYSISFSQPQYKSIRQCIFGILKSGSVQLAAIGRSLSEPITHKKPQNG